tara:strand:+ start:245 stop:1225 length:981 start_codon:yes stop_codon:yes gene_type:complete
MNRKYKERARGCFLGQLIGDALGTRYEFSSSLNSKLSIKKDIHNGFLDIKGGGPFKLGVGQVTDDSELALGLTRTISKYKKYEKEKVAEKYISWFKSNPFDIGNSTRNAFLNAKNYNDIIRNSKKYNKNSLSNGCLMRISPLAILGYKIDSELLEENIISDCMMTNPNKICIDATIVFVFSIKEAIKTGKRDNIYNLAIQKAKTDIVKNLLQDALIQPYPVNINGRWFNPDSEYQGYFGFAFQNAFYHILNGENFYKSMVETMAMGGDTDTNGCIAGSLLGAYYGIEYIPKKWIYRIINAKFNYNRLEKYPDVNTKDIIRLVNSII